MQHVHRMRHVCEKYCENSGIRVRSSGNRVVAGPARRGHLTETNRIRVELERHVRGYEAK